MCHAAQHGSQIVRHVICHHARRHQDALLHQVLHKNVHVRDKIQLRILRTNSQSRLSFIFCSYVHEAHANILSASTIWHAGVAGVMTFLGEHPFSGAPNMRIASFWCRQGMRQTSAVIHTGSYVLRDAFSCAAVFTGRRNINRPGGRKLRAISYLQSHRMQPHFPLPSLEHVGITSKNSLHPEHTCT